MERIHKKIRGCRVEANKIEKMFVYINTSCNLKCSYCFYSLNANKKVLSIEAFKKSLKTFLKLSENPQIIIIGGEPLLEKKRIMQIMKYAKEKARVSLFTNATLIDKEISEFIKENNIKIIVSIDGDIKTNDRNRRFKTERESVYKRVLYLLEKYKITDRALLNMVVTPQTINYLSSNIMHLKTKGFKSIGISFDYSTNWNKKSIEILKKEIRKTFMEYAKMLKRKDAYRFINMYEIFDKIQNKKIPQCPNLILFPDGKFYLCDKIISMDSKEREKFMIKTDINKERKKFFDSMKKKGVVSSQAFCSIGIYLYLKYVKKLNSNILKKEFFKKIKLQKEIEKLFTKYFRSFIKIRYFREIHQI